MSETDRAGLTVPCLAGEAGDRDGGVGFLAFCR